MPSLFERPYRAAAATELERSVREIEDRNKKAQTKESFQETTSKVTSNINFAETLNLITAQQAEAYRERVEKAKEERERMERSERQGDEADNFESNTDRAEKQMSMEEVRAEISRERAAENAQRYQSQQSKSTPAYTKGEEDGARTH